MYSQQWDWAKTFYGSGHESANACVGDAAGNVYVTGVFSDSVITSGSTSLVNHGNYDVFLVKYDPNGSILWAQNFGGTDGESVSAVIKDASGNIYLAGAFNSPTITFGTFTLTKDTMYGGNMFLAKLNAGGTVLWAKQAGGNSVEWISSEATDAAGNIYITGGFRSPTLTLGSTVLYNGGWQTNLFTAKVDPSGNFLWAKSIDSYLHNSSADYVVPAVITADQAGNSYAAGYFSDSIIVIENDTLRNPGYYDQAFVVKYDPNGNKVWAKAEGHAALNSLSTDPSGNFYMAGYFRTPNITFGTYTLNGPGTTQYTRVLLVKCDAGGNVLWAKTSNDSNADHAINCVNTDNAGNVYIVGTYGQPITFGSYPLSRTSEPKKMIASEIPSAEKKMDPPHSNKMFIALFDASGMVQYAEGLGGNWESNMVAVSPDNAGHVYVCGSFSSDTLHIGATTMPNSGYYSGFPNSSDMFIAKLNMNATGIKTSEDVTGMTVFPVPSTGVLHVTLPDAKNAMISVYDISGNCVFRKSCNGKLNQEIDLSNQSKGIYFLKAVSGDRMIVKKVILE